MSARDELRLFLVAALANWAKLTRRERQRLEREPWPRQRRMILAALGAAR
jgi:hypothetical protein